MRVFNLNLKETIEIEIKPVTETDYKTITRSRFWFNWREEINHEVYKLSVKESDEILGLISLETITSESRIQIRLLAVSKENRGNHKTFDHIAGNLIAFACIKSVKLFGEWACVSMIPKTDLIEHYKSKYIMTQTGRHLLLDGIELIQIINKYDHE